MKHLFLLISFIALGLQGYSQCTPNPNLPDDFLGIDPLADYELPCDTIVPQDSAVVNEEYVGATFTIFIPSSISVVNLDSVALNPADATPPGITGLPSGMTYVCDPPNCVFPTGTAQCLEIIGTPDNSNAPGIYDLEISAFIYGAGFPNPPVDPIRFPLPEDPADYNDLESLLVNVGGVNLPVCPYQIDLRASTPTKDLIHDQLTIGQNTPNPFSGVTRINVNAEVGDYTFSVYNMVGELIHTEEMRLNGEEVIEYDASLLDAGLYIYSFSNEFGSISKRMMVK